MVFLTVPYAEKDAAKALGARWNPTRRRSEERRVGKECPV